MRKTPYYPLLMWFLPLAFFGYQFILRLWPSLMMQHIMLQFSIDATAFGLLASVYYYGYAGMQIPIAMLLDRFKVQYVIASCALLCAVAILIFTYSDNWYLALLSRFLIGAGSAVGFLSTSKVVSEWFAKNHYARMIGFTFSIGIMGAIYGGKPISLLVERFGTASVSLILTAVAVGIGFLTFCFLRAPEKEAFSVQYKIRLSDFKNLLSSKAIWLLALVSLLMVGTLEGFADVWGVNYLMTAYSIAKSDAAELVSFIFAGMLFGGPFLAFCSKKIGNYTVISLCAVIMAGIFIDLLWFTPLFNWYFLAFCFFSLGVLCCYQVIIFALGAELVSRELLGVTVAFLNCINMLGGSFFHSIIGFLMDLCWQGEMSGSIRQYPLSSYEFALMVIPASALIGAGIISLLGVKQRRKLSANA